MTPTLKEALAACQRGAWAAAEQLCQSILNAEPRQFEALTLIGIIAARTGRTRDAADFLRLAVAANPNSASAHNNHGNVLRELKRFDEALQSYDRALSLDTRVAEVHNNRAVALQELGRFAAALDGYERALKLKPDYPEAWNNRGNTLRSLERCAEALESFERALEINPRYAEALNNRGVTLEELGRLEEALECFDRALEIKPGYAEAHNNRGTTLKRLARYEEALESIHRALRVSPASAPAHYNLGLTLHEMRRFADAIASYEHALAIRPEEPWLRGSLMHAKAQICDWSDLNSRVAELVADIERGTCAVRPFPVLARIDSAAIQRRAAEIWVNATNRSRHSLPPLARRARGPKIRIGYYSADYRNHATAYLAAELFERHDRGRFEVVAFSFGPEAHDEMHRRLAASFERFIDVRQRSDRQVAELSREMQIDIAVDLKGFTQDARTGIFWHRAAPIQVSYLGYPGTMGAPYIDYLIADAVLIPQEHRRHYAEKVVYLPGSYQVNDRRRRVAERDFSRAELGLPESSFVFCCFNSNYKIGPETFDGWMRILRQVDDSVLWLLADHEIAARNLRQEAQARGVPASRLIFAPRMPLAEHLARHHAADLFLDTVPCNAHTTASDALWTGLPVLTRIGESFAARVAASLLHAVGLPELIAASAERYEQIAIELAGNPSRLARIREKLTANRMTTLLFDSERFTRHLEAAYAAMYERYHQDLDREDIHVRG